jgi:hypothetical protein
VWQFQHKVQTCITFVLRVDTLVVDVNFALKKQIFQNVGNRLFLLFGPLGYDGFGSTVGTLESLLGNGKQLASNASGKPSVFLAFAPDTTCHIRGSRITSSVGARGITPVSDAPVLDATWFV